MVTLSDNSKGSFICIIPDRIIHTMAFVKPVVEYWMKREIAQKIDPMTHHTMSERSYHGATSHSLLLNDAIFQCEKR